MKEKSDTEKLILEKLSNIEDMLEHISHTQAKKNKYNLIDDWKKNIQDNCEHIKYVGLEECEFACKLINNICNMPNCPKNILEK